MNNDTSRRELEKRLSQILANGNATGFEMANIRQVLTNARDAAMRRAWTDPEWEELAQAIERLTQEPIEYSAHDGRVMVQRPDGSPLAEHRIADSRLLMQNGSKIVEEMERLRVLVEATMLTLRLEEQDVMELIASSIDMLQINDCGDDPAQGLDDVCPCCRLRSALRRMGERQRGQT